MSLTARMLTAISCAALLSTACDKSKPENLAPVASALQSAAPSAPQAVALAVDSSSSNVRFLMEAPIEKISGEAPAAIEGQLFVNLNDLAKSTALVKVDLDKLTLYQEKRDSEKGAFSEKKKNDLQNEHARTWLEISSDAPEDVRKANRFAEFGITRLEDLSTKDITTLAGSSRQASALAVGEFRLHGRKSEKRVKVNITFQFAGEKLEWVKVTTLDPLAIGLEEFDVRPREAFGKLAQKTLGALGSKVAQTAPLRVEFTARAR